MKYITIQSVKHLTHDLNFLLNNGVKCSMFNQQHIRAISTAYVPAELVTRTTIRTCVDLYPSLREIYPRLISPHAPSEGLDITIEYADTIQDNFDKIVVAIPGALGYYGHFKQVLDHFRGTSTRVVALNLPDFSHTRLTKHFWHTTPEKVCFVKDLLHHLNIQKVDCLIGHSMGIQTVAGLWEKPGELDIRSVALFAPQPFWGYSKRQLQQSKYAQKFFFTFHNELWYRLIELTRVHKLKQWPMRMESVNDLYHFLVPILDPKSPEDLHRRVEMMAKQLTYTPLALLYGDKERLIPRKAMRQLNEELGLQYPQDVIYIDPKKETVDEVVIQRQRITSFVIKGGAHFVHANFAPYANRMIENLLNYHQKTSSVSSSQ